jgi:hypothetical protein
MSIRNADGSFFQNNHEFILTTRRHIALDTNIDNQWSVNDKSEVSVSSCIL